MSEQAIADFFAKLDADTALKQEVIAHAAADQGEVSGLVEIATQRGYEFTTDEFKGFVDKIREAEEGSLSDKDLENVAGGVLSFTALKPSSLASINKLLGTLGHRE